MSHLARRSALWIVGLATLGLVGYLLLFAIIGSLTLLDARGDLGRCYEAAPRGMIGIVAMTGSGFVLPVLLIIGLVSLRGGGAGRPWALIGTAAACLAALLVGYGAESCEFIGLFGQYNNGDGLEYVERDTFALCGAVAALIVAVSVLLLRRRRA